MLPHAKASLKRVLLSCTKLRATSGQKGLLDVSWQLLQPGFFEIAQGLEWQHRVEVGAINELSELKTLLKLKSGPEDGMDVQVVLGFRSLIDSIEFRGEKVRQTRDSANFYEI